MPATKKDTLQSVDIESAFAQPQAISPAQQAFPAGVVGTLMPSMAAIPEEFKSCENIWHRWASAWFSSGWPERIQVAARADVDPEMAATHLSTLLGSYQPKHEHKIAAVAYLGSRWFGEIGEVETE